MNWLLSIGFVWLLSFMLSLSSCHQEQMKVNLSRGGTTATTPVVYPPITSGLIMWIDPSDSNSVVTTSSTAVSFVQDKIGNHHLSPYTKGGTLTNEIYYHTSGGIGGLNALDFNDGKALSPTNDVDFDTRSFTIFVVFEVASANAWNFIIGKDNYSWNTGYGLEANNLSLGNYAYNLFGLGPTQRTAITTGTAYVATFHTSTTYSKLRLNGSLATTQPLVYSTSTAAAFEFVIGNSDNSQNLWGLDGLVGEILFYNRELDPSEINTIESYLDTKWR